MQELAKSWVVLQLIGGSSALAALLFASAIPNLFLAPFAGALADRHGIKSILLVTQLLLSVIALAVGLTVSTGHVQLWQLVVFSLVEGVVIAFDLPAFNKITPIVVPKEDFQQALAMNAVNFHLSRVVGPSLAGLVIAFGGEESVFWLNALSFLGLVFVISRIPQLAYQTQAPVQEQGFNIVWNQVRSNPLLSALIAQLFLVVGLMFPLVFTVFRVFIQQKFALNAKDFGFVFSAPGLGALLGGLTFLLWRPKIPLKALPYGVVGVVLFLILVPLSESLFLSVLALTGFSYCMFLTISSLNVTIQLSITNEIRGRVAALIGVGFTSIAPLMSVPIGFGADQFGEENIILVIALLFSLGSAYLAYKTRQLNFY